MQLSKRMQAIADMISPCKVLADVGTDHGYIPIYAVKNGIAQRGIAMDINKGPIERAASHIQEYGLDAYIETRCCDGVAALRSGEADLSEIQGLLGHTKATTTALYLKSIEPKLDHMVSLMDRVILPAASR